MENYQADFLYREAEKLRKRADFLYSVGEDEYEEETIMFFRKCFVEGRKEYSYAAIKSGNLWWVTGKSVIGRTWGQLIDFICENNVIPNPEIWMASELTQVTE